MLKSVQYNTQLQMLLQIREFEPNQDFSCLDQ